METSAELTTHLTSGAVAVYLIEMLKKWPAFSRLTPDTKTLNRLVSAVLAVVAAIGISWSYDAAAGTLVISGLTWGTMLAMTWESIKQFALQQVLYSAVIEPRPVKILNQTPKGE